jgi:hypothetical protein
MPGKNIEFDQVVKGNINVKQLSKKKYKITFSEIDNFLVYQVWSDVYKKLNKNRKVYYQKAKKWVQNFNKLNTTLKTSDKHLFNPTTVMEIGLKKYLFVIYKAKLNGKGQVVFKVSTEEIKLSSGTFKKMLKLPRGHHDGVRFDIDSAFGVVDTSSCTPGDAGSCPGYSCGCIGSTCTAGEERPLGDNWICSSSNTWVQQISTIF